MKIQKTLFLAGIMLQYAVSFSQANFTITPGICINTGYTPAVSTGTLTNCTFTWTSNPGGAIFSAPNGSISALTLPSPLTYSIMLTVVSGTVMSSIQKTVSGFPTPTIQLSQNSLTTCISSNTPLLSKPIALSASGGVSYTWNPSTTPIIGNPNGPTNTVRPTANSCFSVTGEDINGCKAMASVCATVNIRLGISAHPSDTVICKSQNQDGMAILRARLPTPNIIGSLNSLTYIWTSSNPAGILGSPFGSTVAVSPSSTTTYTLEMRDSINCVSIPSTATVSVSVCTGLKEDLGPSKLKIYPNPVKDKLLIVTLESPSETSVEIFNAFGHVVFSKAQPINYELNIESLPAGIYYLRFETGTTTTFRKFIKE